MIDFLSRVYGTERGTNDPRSRRCNDGFAEDYGEIE